MNSEYYIDIEKQKLCLPGEAHMQPPPEMMPRLYFGSEPVIGFVLPEETLKIGDKLLFAIDVDKDFLSTTPMCVAEIAVLGANGTEPLSVSFQTRTARFRDVVNARAGAVKCFFMAFVYRDGAQTTICDDFCFCHSVTALEGDPVVVLPEEFYYTKEQIDAIARQMEEWEQSAKESAEDAADSQTAAVDSTRNSYIWAEGTDEEVQALGGEHSAKGWAQEASGGGTWGSITGDIDDQTDLANALAGKANLENGKVPSGELPVATTSSFGAVKTAANGVWGLSLNNGNLLTLKATNAQIDGKDNVYVGIVPNNLNYAVRSVSPNVTVIPSATTSYNLLDATATTNNHSWQYSHAPAEASSYTLPAVTDTSVAHYIKLTLDFTTVQTYSFLDAGGNAITPLFTPTVSAGDVYEFDCEYSAIKSQWLIVPHKQGAVSDDYVMQSEVGAANGVAGLDASSKLLRSQIPAAGSTSGAYGGVYYNSIGAQGVKCPGGNIEIAKASAVDIDAKTQSFKPIVPDRLNYAVRSVLENVTTIPAATSAYNLLDASATTNYHSMTYEHSPESAPTYTLPAVTDETVQHEIMLKVRFSSTVLTYSFEDINGNALTPLPLAGTIADGSVVAFRCTWEALLGQWVIMPVMLGTYTEVTP